MKSHSSPKNVYGIPGVIGLITIAGLLFALLGDGVWDATSWLLLALPLLVLAFYIFRRSSPAQRSVR